LMSVPTGNSINRHHSPACFVNQPLSSTWFWAFLDGRSIGSRVVGHQILNKGDRLPRQQTSCRVRLFVDLIRQFLIKAAMSANSERKAFVERHRGFGGSCHSNAVAKSIENFKTPSVPQQFQIRISRRLFALAKFTTVRAREKRIDHLGSRRHA